MAKYENIEVLFVPYDEVLLHQLIGPNKSVTLLEKNWYRCYGKGS